jgi:tRNA dimethylallyltransferase
MPQRIIFLVGPTGIGKSKAALYLAKKINAEIISCDSMQVYKGMNILTSKPSAKERKAITHHLIGVMPLSDEYDVSRYRKDAVSAVSRILRKGKTPLFVGGTGLYMTVLLDGIFKAKPIPKKIRKQLCLEAEKFGSVYLHALLKNIDPDAAKIIHPNDTKRIIRALEIFKGTGRTISELKKARSGLYDKYEVKVFCLNMDRKKLYRRIDRRVDLMFRRGAVNEVKLLCKKKLGRTAVFAIGVREINDYLDWKATLKETKEIIKKNTRNYAKRQLTWFRKDERINWINIKEKDTPQAIAKRIWKKLS